MQPCPTPEPSRPSDVMIRDVDLHRKFMEYDVGRSAAYRVCVNVQHIHVHGNDTGRAVYVHMLYVAYYPHLYFHLRVRTLAYPRVLVLFSGPVLFSNNGIAPPPPEPPTARDANGFLTHTQFLALYRSLEPFGADESEARIRAMLGREGRRRLEAWVASEASLLPKRDATVTTCTKSHSSVFFCKFTKNCHHLPGDAV